MTQHKIAFVFPGQGSQAVGMGKDLAEEAVGREVFDTFDQGFLGGKEALPVSEPAGFLKLSQVCFEGPEETLKRTIYTQPAILATSIAALRVFQGFAPAVQPAFLAGHSLGEYGALYAAEVITLGQAANLIQQRAVLMERAPAGSMSAVLGLNAAAVETVLASWWAGHKEGVVALANDNSEAQIVLSGDDVSVEAIAPLLKAAGAKRILPLPVGGAFHSPMMTPAAQAFAAVLSDFEFRDARVPIITNVDALPEVAASVLRGKLAQQIDHTVRWTSTMRRLVEDGVDTVIEFGPGKVLTGLFGRMFPQLRLFNVYDVASAKSVAESFVQAASLSL
jgi:[acyl-carrier-protein] S-malonyltransferase